MEEKKQNNIDSTNIFDEFSNDENLKKEIKKEELKRSRGGIYYLNSFNGFLKALNLIFVLVLILFSVYSYIQNKKDLDDSYKEFLSPFCSILQNNYLSSCSGVNTDLSILEKKINYSQGVYYDKILGMVGSVYELSNFAFSKEVLFLLDKSDSRLKPLEILKEFNNLKLEFEPINKNKIKCLGVSILDDGIMSLNCDFFSSEWDREILGTSGKTEKKDTVGGTSISYASSFINFLEKNSKKFILIDKPKKYTSNSFVGAFGFTKKTTIKLRLKFKNNNGLLK